MASPLNRGLFSKLAYQEVVATKDVSIGDLFWIFIIISTVLPMLKQRQIESARFRLIKAIEMKHNSRLITLIHRQESMSILGFLVGKYINIEDSEQVLRAIRFTPPDMPIDLVLHTPGGLVLASEQIARALENHPSKVTVFVPHYAMSGGTMIALAADEIIMDENAVLGPVDPQLGEYPAASILKVIKDKNLDKVDDRTLIMADIARKALAQVKDFVTDLLKDNIGEEKANMVSEELTQGKWTHDFPIVCSHLKEMGLPVRNEMPKEIYELMELYPQPPQRRPSVQYIPVPYFTDNKDKK